MATYQEIFYLGEYGAQEQRTLNVKLERIGDGPNPALWRMEVPALKIIEILPKPYSDEREARAEARVLLRGKLKEKK